MEYSSSPEPPLSESYQALLDISNTGCGSEQDSDDGVECDLPVIDMRRLKTEEREACKAEIVEAAREWGFFQVVGHGVSRKLMEKMKSQQVELFRQPFHVKAREHECLNLSPGSYRWGTPSATCLAQFSWSEAFHVPLTNLSTLRHGALSSSLCSTMEEYAARVSDVAQELAEILAEKVGNDPSIFVDKCLPESSYIRMNRYPACPISAGVMGITPHTDSDFLTILYQDQVGGLQLLREDTWFTVKPNPKSLIINIGDLFQAWSNGVYTSVEHRVLTNPCLERFSTAYFFCPSYDAVIPNCFSSPIYREFSFREYKQQVQNDVQTLGFKVGLSRFLI